MVGNGPSVLARSTGSLVDQYDLVVRFNDFVTIGYERMVGSRTDVWVRNFESKDREFDGLTVFLYPKRFHGSNQVRTFMSGRRFDDVVDPDLYERVDREIGFDTGWSSSGCVAIRYFLSQGHHVSLLGFDHFSGGLHYYEDRRGGFRFHGPDKERAFVDRLVSEGAVARI